VWSVDEGLPIAPRTRDRGRRRAAAGARRRRLDHLFEAGEAQVV
jgi:hypothetical protein